MLFLKVHQLWTGPEGDVFSKDRQYLSLIRWDLRSHMHPFLKICSCIHFDHLAPMRCISEYMWSQQNLQESRKIHLFGETYRMKELQAADCMNKYLMYIFTFLHNQHWYPPTPHLNFCWPQGFIWEYSPKVRFLLLSGSTITVNLWGKTNWQPVVE